MGTRALINVKENDKTLVTIYRQFDGYPEGLGLDIKNCLGNKVVVNGWNDPAIHVNGMGCAAAMLIAHLKDGCGNVYIYPTDEKDVGESYTYTLYKVANEIHMNVENYKKDSIYKGPIRLFEESFGNGYA